MFASLLHGRAFVLFALFVIQALMLVRSVTVARYLGPEQFGIAVTFVLIQQFMDMATDTGLNKYLLQSREGNRSAVQATVQLVSLVRGVFAAILLVVLGHPILSSLGLAESIYPLLLLAGTSLAFGLVHFDNARLQRRENYLNESLSNLTGEVFGLATAMLALIFIRDYTVMLYAMVARSIAVAAASHILARRSWRVRYDVKAATPMWVFIRPLLINGPLLFFSAQADRVMVSTVLGPLELGIYSAALLLVSTPCGFLTRFLGTTYMPRLAAEHRNRLGVIIERDFKIIVLLCFIAIASGFAALGGFAVQSLYGAAYMNDIVVITLIGCTQAVRFARTWPSSLALASAHTGTLLSANFLRLVALPLGLVGLIVHEGLLGLAIGMLAGELISLLAAILLFNRASRRPARSDLGIVALVAVICVVIPLSVWSLGGSLWAAFATGTIVGIPLFVTICLRNFGRPSLRAILRWGQSR